MTREELALEAHHLDLLDALAAAKKSGDRDAQRKAATELSEFRQKWRGVREAFGVNAGPGDGIAVPQPMGAPSKKAG